MEGEVIKRFIPKSSITSKGGGEVLTEHIGKQEMTDFGEDRYSDEQIYKRDVSWIKASDVVVAEVSTPSLGVGYEIRKAEELGKRILCFYIGPKREKGSLP